MKLNILLVDDDIRILSVLKSLLTEEKHAVTTCHNGLDAIETCLEQKFDVIITDLMMPGANGIEVLKEVRKIYPDTLVLLITGFASIETAVQAIREGAYDYITKPFKLEEIKVVVKNAGDKDHAKDHSDGTMFKKEEPLIAGSMLTHYYLENKYGSNQPLFSDLERISALRDRGFLSEEEFDLCKQKLFKNQKL
jgi:DNA-binding NtrC family response regulator